MVGLAVAAESASAAGSVSWPAAGVSVWRGRTGKEECTSVEMNSCLVWRFSPTLWEMCSLRPS